MSHRSHILVDSKSLTVSADLSCSAGCFTDSELLSLGGDLWTAKWWTEGDTPGGAGG